MENLNKIEAYLIGTLQDYKKPKTAKDLLEGMRKSEIKCNSSKLRKAVNNLRKNKMPICSDHRGYYISTDYILIELTIKHLENRIKGIQNAILGLKEYQFKNI